MSRILSGIQRYVELSSMEIQDTRLSESMDIKSESMSAHIAQLKRDRWPYVIGHIGATLAVIGVAWAVADHTKLLWFGVAHLLSTWLLAAGLYFPLRAEQNNLNRIPLRTYLGVVICNATLGSALLFDLSAANEPTFTLTVGIVLFAGIAGSFITLGMHATLMRVAMTSLLVPYIFITFLLGHYAISLGTLFFYCNVVVAGVWKLSIGHKELVALRINAAHRAEIAESDAETDPLTGLVNRRGVERLDGMRLKSGVAALYFDLNKFKSINDTYGHGAGDEVLKTVAQRLRSSVASDDVVARLGGDEFLVLMFGEEAKSIDAVIERLTMGLRQPVKVSDDLVLNISAAIGQSYTNAAVLDLNSLLENSDQAMYRSKSAKLG